MNTQEFIKHVNSLRLANKGNWYQDTGEVNGKEYKLKGYGTYLQVLAVNMIRFGGLHDITVAQFKLELAEAANSNQQPVMQY